MPTGRARLGWRLLHGALGGGFLPLVASAQRQADVPVSPAAIIGPVTTASTLSVMGVSARPAGDATGIGARQAVWMGVSQPLAQAGRLQLSAIGSGQWQPRDRAGGTVAAEGTLAVRALASLGTARAWGAATYGRAALDGEPLGALLAGGGMLPGVAGDAMPVDTTVSRRVDVGQLARIESGLLTAAGPFEFAVGVAVERASRVTTQTLTIDLAEAVAPAVLPPVTERTTTVRTLRAVQRRDLARGMASVGFVTGPTSWLVAVTAPIKSWISGDERLPRPPIAPAVASLTVSQPLTGWLSLVGAASTGQTAVGSTILRDDLVATRRGIAPVFALGVRIARLPIGARGDVPGGILGVESRLVGGHAPGALPHHALDSLPLGPDMTGSVPAVELLVDAPRAGSVALMGDATEWQVVPLERLRDGKWRAVLHLPPGVHRLLLRSDNGPWMPPPGMPTGNDDFGTPVGLLILRAPR